MMTDKRFVELEDIRWFPTIIRSGMMDFLGYFLTRVNAYHPVPGILAKLSALTGETKILDLCSGSGQITQQVMREVSRRGKELNLLMSDLFPHRTGQANDNLYYPRPVDARSVPENMEGIRTMFSAMHHFPPDELKDLLRRQAEEGKTIAFFDGGDKNILPFLIILFVFPVLFFLSVPLIRPFRLSRVFFTWFIPLIPLFTMWDGCISILRLYTANDLFRLTSELNVPSYIWKSGTLRHYLGFHVNYVIGYSLKSDQEDLF